MPKTVSVLFNKVYVPEGFDDNDNVQVVGEGMFAHTCYRHAQTTAAVDRVKKIITLSPVAYLYPALMCLEVILPYNRVVDVGILEAGDWSITQSDHKIVGRIHIKKALQAAPDDFLYAPVSQAFLQSSNSQNQIYITGNFVSSCMHMKEVKVVVQPDVITVQPISEMENRADCTTGQFPFEKKVGVDLLHSSRYLLHVRSMNGNAVNQLVDAL